MKLASDLGLPLITVIDTPGAALSQQAEEGGLAREIALCLADLLTLEAPSLTVLLGQGCGGGAIALLPANRVIAAQNSWLSPLPPEGASAIVHRTADRAAEMARAQKVSSQDLLELGVVDRIVPELVDAAMEPEAFCLRLGEVVRFEIAGMSGMSRAAVREGRLARFSDPVYVH
jgi:acetyl-CoA carboxylase carboxyl transferase subunit beta